MIKEQVGDQIEEYTKEFTIEIQGNEEEDESSETEAISPIFDTTKQKGNTTKRA